MKVLVSGATGLVGTALIDYLTSSRVEILRLSRAAASAAGPTVQWDPARASLPAKDLEGVDAVVHLAGQSVAGRWTKRSKQAIRDSRIVGTRLLSQTLAQLPTPPRVLICASAVGYYGDRGTEVCTESSRAGAGFLAAVAADWEAATAPAVTAGIRVVQLRIGAVLSPSGGALATMMLPFGLGLGGRLGSGGQYMSWVTLDDLVRIVDYVLLAEDLRGPVNAVAPQAVTNAEFTKSLGRALRRPTVLPVPGFVLRLLLGEMAEALLLASTRATPSILQAHGYEYVHPELDAALMELVGGGPA